MRSLWLASLAVLACAVAGCSANADDDNSFGATGGTAGATGGNTGDSGPAGSGGGDLDAEIPINPESGPSDTSPPSDGDTCSAQTVAAEPYPLDMYVMLDQSGSMTAEIGLSGKTQWDAAVEAFTNFLNTTPTTGLSMGIQYFPLPVSPWSSMPPCDPNAPECGDDVCVTVDTGPYCHASCTTHADCDPASECRGSSPGFCSNDRCDDSAYATPEVEIGEIPGVNAALIASLQGHGPLTMTPTGPALRGAISHAREWATAHPDHTTIVILATDGMPTVCPADASDVELTNAVKAAAQEGVNGTPSIRTFVIGVVTTMDFIAVNNLNAFAQAGGTGQATIVSPNQDMTAQLAAALEAIRGAAMPCEFHIPPDPSIDFHKVNVVYTNTSGQTFDVYYVGDASQCDPENGGWYYDADPDQSDPTKIILCPASCDFIQSYGGKIDIALGCDTITPPPK